MNAGTLTAASGRGALLRSGVDGRAVVVGTVGLLLLVFAVAPLALLLARSLTAGDRPGIENYLAVATRPADLNALRNTLVLAGLTTLGAALAGVPLAWLVTRTDLPARGFFRSALLLPYLVPPFIGAIAWIELLNPRVGYVSRALMAVFGGEEGPLDVHSFAGLVWVMTLHFYPYVFVTTAAALERMDASLEEAARSSGAGTLPVLLTITLPLVSPSVAAGGLLAFVAAAANFGTPALIGGPARIFVLPTRVAAYVSVGSPEGLREGTALAVLLMALALVALCLSARLTHGRRFTTVTGRAARPAPAALGWARFPVAVLLALWVAGVAVLPLAAVVATSLLRGWGTPLSLEGLTLENYRYVLFEHHLTGVGLRNSLLLAVGSATIAVLVGMLVAYMRLRLRSRLASVIDLAATLPYAIPGTVLALGMILAFSGHYRLNLYNTFWILLVAYAVKDLAFGVRTCTGSLEQLHVSLEEAARNAGAGWTRTVRDIVAPLARPALIGGWLLVFIPAFRELTMSILLYGPNTPTSGVALYELQSGGYYQSAAALAVVVLTIVLAGNVLVRRLTHGAVGF